jgi:UDP-4-amino-4,6-dideoxy-N-acetyl-beta-L-altrosamine N-acetyltransferase
MTNAFLVGSRVYLRPLEASDAERVAGWFNDPDVRRNLKTHRPMSHAAEEKFIANIGSDGSEVVLAIVERESDEHIGVIGLHQIDARSRHGMFGIAIGKKAAWGRGFGSDALATFVRHAFETLNLHRVWLQVYDTNPRAARCYEKVGFRREGVMRQHQYLDGKYVDAIVMGLLREEWAPHTSPR